MIKKEFSIIIPLKNRTSIAVDYEPIPLRVIERNDILLSGLQKKHIKRTTDGQRIILDLLLNFLTSLQNIKLEDETFEIVIVDFGSDDYDLNSLHLRYPLLEFIIIKNEDYFSRGKGLNIGYHHSTKSNIFFCDADMFLSNRNLFDKAYDELNNNKILFPICFSLCEPSHQIGYWRRSGYGMSLMTRDILETNNFKWSEYDSLGKEDDDFWSFFNKLNVCSRYEINGYYHQWHPESQEFKNRFYKYNDIKKKKVFFNCSENLLSITHAQKIGKEIENTDDIYIVHKPEKFLTSIVTFDIPEIQKIISITDITDYIKKHNRLLKHHVYTSNIHLKSDKNLIVHICDLNIIESIISQPHEHPL